VQFHGGCLNGRIVRSDDPRTGLITDFWNAEAIFVATQAQTGARMFGVGPEGWKLFQQAGSRAVVSGDMDHAYRVISVRRQDSALTINVQHERSS